MAGLIPNDIDFNVWMRQTDAAVKVRKASSWQDDVNRLFAVTDEEDKTPDVRSIKKMRGRLRFRPSEVTCWTGYNGHRKSMFLGQVALDLVAAGEKVLIISLEMSPERTLQRMCQQSIARRYPSPKQVSVFNEWSDGLLWLYDQVGRTSPDVVWAVCRYFAQELKGQHVIIDSMMMVCESEESLDQQKQFSTDVVRVAQETGLHLHVVTHCRKPSSGDERPPSKYDIRGSASISDQAHNVVVVWSNKAKQAKLSESPTNEEALAQPDARVSVEKQRNGSFEGFFNLWFDSSTLRFMEDRTSPVEPYDMGRA